MLQAGADPALQAACRVMYVLQRMLCHFVMVDPHEQEIASTTEEVASNCVVLYC